MRAPKIRPAFSSAVWAVDFGEGTQTIVPTAMLALDSGVVVAGTISSGGLVLNGVDLGASGTFVAKFDGSTGTAGWIKGIGAAANVTVTAMAERASAGTSFDRELLRCVHPWNGDLGCASHQWPWSDFRD